MPTATSPAIGSDTASAMHDVERRSSVVLTAAIRASCVTGEFAVASEGSDATDIGSAAVSSVAYGAGLGNSLRESKRNGSGSLSAGEAAVALLADDTGGASVQTSDRV